MQAGLRGCAFLRAMPSARQAWNARCALSQVEGSRFDMQCENEASLAIQVRERNFASSRPCRADARRERWSFLPPKEGLLPGRHSRDFLWSMPLGWHRRWRGDGFRLRRSRDDRPRGDRCVCVSLSFGCTLLSFGRASFGIGLLLRPGVRRRGNWLHGGWLRLRGVQLLLRGAFDRLR